MPKQPVDLIAQHKALTMKMTDEQLKRAADQIGALRSLKGNKNIPALSNSNHDDWVLMAIIEAMRDYGEVSSARQLINSKDYAPYKEKRDELMKWLRKVTTPRDKDANRNLQISLLKRGVALLYKNLTTEKGHIDPRTNKWKPHPSDINARHILRNLHRIPGVINAKLPDYAHNGMLSFFLNMKRVHTSKDNRREETDLERLEARRRKRKSAATA